MKDNIYMAVTRTYTIPGKEKLMTEFVDLYFKNPGKNYRRKHEKIPFTCIEHLVDDIILGKEIKVRKCEKKNIEFYEEIPGLPVDPDNYTINC